MWMWMQAKLILKNLLIGNLLIGNLLVGKHQSVVAAAGRQNRVVPTSTRGWWRDSIRFESVSASRYPALMAFSKSDGLAVVDHDGVFCAGIYRQSVCPDVQWLLTVFQCQQFL